MPLTLFGVTVNDAHLSHVPVPGTELVGVRELAAVCAPAAARSEEPGEDDVRRHSDAIARYAERGPILPAPVGVVFRSRESIQRWLELHYGALTDAISFVENRVAARVHVMKQSQQDRESRADLSSIAAESMRALRQVAVATVPLKQGNTASVLSAAFLVEAAQWPDFVAMVQQRSTLSSTVRFDVTGPWPPYDFVQMQLGA